jgi:amino acid transporter
MSESYQPTALASNSIGFWRSLAQPIAAQAPSAGVALIPATMAAVTGSYGTASFLLGLIAGLFLSFVFIQLSRRIASAGAVYSFARMMVGAGMAFVVAWCYLGNDIFVGSGIISQSADYLNSAFQMSFGHVVNWVIIAIVVWLLVFFLASRSVKVSTSILLVVEGITCLIVLIGGVIVLAKGGYGGHNFGFQAFSLKGISLSNLFFGISIAFLGFGGFDQATALGEESKNPKRTIPITIIVSVLFSGLFYTFGSWVESVGFHSASNLAASSTPLFTVIHNYVSPTIAIILAYTTTISAFSSVLALTVHGSRLLFALFRDGFVSRRLAVVQKTQKSPITALIVLVVPLFIFSVGFFWTSPADAFDYMGTAGGLLLSIVYFLISISALWYFSRNKNVINAIVSLISSCIVGYALYSSISPMPAYPFNIIIYLAFVYVLIGICVISFNKRLRTSLSSSTIFRDGNVDSLEGEASL